MRGSRRILEDVLCSHPTALVTGGAGFVGSRLVRALLRNGDAQVVAYDDFSAGTREYLPPLQGLTLVEGDVRDATHLRRLFHRFRPTVVYHFAALHFIPFCEAHQDTAWHVNVFGTQTLLEACADCPPKRLLFASTGAVYGSSLALLSESAPLAPVGIYAHSKLAAERLIGAYAQQAATRTTIARLFNLYGSEATSPHVVADILFQLNHGNDLQLGNLETTRDYLHVTDAVTGLLAVDAWAARTVDTKTSVFNVGSGQGRTVREIVGTLVKLTGRPLRVTRVESRVRATEPLALVADVSKILQATGWAPALSFDVGLHRMLDERLESNNVAGRAIR